tara:strand:- start:902 stop:2809 length:1908 start_codon:yes stop_codon:yes gene_type:complete
MPKLPSYEQSVGPATFTAPTLGTGAVQSPAVAGITQANLGDGILKAGTNFAQTATKLAIANRTRRDQTLYLDLSNQFTEWNINARRDMSMLTGKEAIGSTTQYMKSSKQHIDMLVQDVEPRIQSAIRERLEANALSAAQNISVSEATQHQAYEQAEAANATVLTARNAVGFLSATGTKPLVVKTGTREETTYINHLDADGKHIPGLSMEAHYAIADAKQAAFDEQINLGAGENTAEAAAQDAESEIYVDYVNQMISEYPLHGVHFLDQYEEKIVNATTRKTLRQTAENAYFAKSGADKGVDLFSTMSRQEYLQGDGPITQDQIDVNVAEIKQTLMLDQNMDARELTAAFNALDLISNQEKIQIQGNLNTSITNVTRTLTETNGDMSQVNQNELANINRHSPDKIKAINAYATFLVTEPPVATDWDVWNDLNEMAVENPALFLQEELILFRTGLADSEYKEMVKRQNDMKDPAYIKLQAAEMSIITNMAAKLFDMSDQDQKGEAAVFKNWGRGLIESIKDELKVKELSSDKIEKLLEPGAVLGTWRGPGGTFKETFRGQIPAGIGQDPTFTPDDRKSTFVGAGQWKKDFFADWKVQYPNIKPTGAEALAGFNVDRGSPSTEDLRNWQKLLKRSKQQ